MGTPDGTVDYEELFENVKDKPCTVDSIDRLYERAGKELRTRSDIINREIDRVLEAKTLEEIHEALDKAGSNLSQLGVFKRIDILITEEPQEHVEACTVLLDLEEKNWYKVHAGTYVQGHETSCEIGVGLHNITGRAEHIDITGDFGSEKSSQFAVRYELPRVYGLPINVFTRAHRLIHSEQRSSSYTEHLNGGLIGLKSADGMHSIQYEMGWRRLVDSTRLASKSVQSQMGDFLKSSIKYHLLVDQRAVHRGQHQGWALKSSSELFGLGPDTSLRLAKQQLDLVVSAPIFKTVSLNLQATAGLLLPWGDDYMNRPTCIADRFFLGGPSTLRGFSHRSVGPTDIRRPPAAAAGSAGESSSSSAVKRDALGGDVYTSLLASLQFQLPHDALKALNIHGHIFVNGGNAAHLSGISRSPQESAKVFGTTFRWSTGAGLVVPTWFGRFEANYVWILSKQEHDRCKQGLQLGFAPSVL